MRYVLESSIPVYLKGKVFNQCVLPMLTIFRLKKDFGRQTSASVYLLYSILYRIFFEKWIPNCYFFLKTRMTVTLYEWYWLNGHKKNTNYLRGEIQKMLLHFAETFEKVNIFFVKRTVH